MHSGITECRSWGLSTRHGPVCIGCGSAYSMAAVASSRASALPPLAVPGERRGMPVPSIRGLPEPLADLFRGLRMLATEHTALEDALDGFRHVQPTAAQGCVERHDPAPAQPHDQLRGLVTGQIAPH